MMYSLENGRGGRTGRRTKKQKTFTQKQLAAQAQSRAAFKRAREIWSAVPGCDPYQALRQAWSEVKSGRMASNPAYDLRMLRVNPGIEVVENDGKFHIYQNGIDTGKYYMTREKAEDKASQM